MLPASRAIQILSAAVFFGLICVAGAEERRVRRVDPLHMAEAGFSGFLATRMPDKPPAILVAEVPCNGDACVHLGIEASSRHHLMRNLPQIAAGFGTSADVVELEFASRGGNISASSLRLLVRAGAKVAPEELAERAGGMLQFLKVLSGLTRPEFIPFSPRSTPPDRAVHFIYSVTVKGSGQEYEAFLLSPPEAAPPAPGVPTSACIEGETTLAGVHKTAPFAGWKKYRVSWTRVCNGEGKALQSDERAKEDR